MIKSNTPSMRFFRNRPRTKTWGYGRIRNCEMIWAGPIFILITNRQRAMHPIKFHRWNKRCTAPMPR